MKPSTDSKTWANLQGGLAPPSAAVRTKYDYFASLAKKEGYEQISAIFKDTASNEKEHAELWLKQLGEGESTTLENLKTAAQGEHGEWTEMYRDYAQQAREEGYPEIAALFVGVAETEREHEMRFNAWCIILRHSAEDFFQGERRGVGVPQLRACPGGQRGAQNLPRLRPSAG